MDEPEQPSQYEATATDAKRPEENFWLERMKLRIGEAGSFAGHKGCPNKYNIYHKCSLFCVNRWGDGHVEPSRDYIKRYKRLLRRYPLPKGWTEMYDPGCGCFYFFNTVDNLVSWLPPTHPKSELTKCAAAYRRQLEEANTGVGGSTVDDETENTDDDVANIKESAEARHQREIDDIIRHSMRSRSPPLSNSHESSPALPIRKQKSRDLEKTLRQRREREHDRGRDRERDQDRGGHGRSRHYGRNHNESESVLDPMDPSAYSDIPRGKWSDGLNVGDNGSGEGRKKTSSARGGEQKLKGKVGNKSDNEEEDD